MFLSLLKSSPSNKISPQPIDVYGVKLNSEESTVVTVGEVFTKKWRVINLGAKPWENIVLENRASNISAELKTVSNKIIVPYTPVGGVAVISIIFKAPNYPCKASSEWRLFARQASNITKFPHISCSLFVLTAPLLKNTE